MPRCFYSALVKCGMQNATSKLRHWVKVTDGDSAVVFRTLPAAFRILLNTHAISSTDRLAVSSSSCDHHSLRRSNNKHRQRSLPEFSAHVSSPDAEHVCDCIQFRENLNNFLFGSTELGRTNVGSRSIRQSPCPVMSFS